MEVAQIVITPKFQMQSKVIDRVERIQKVEEGSSFSTKRFIFQDQIKLKWSVYKINKKHSHLKFRCLVW
jgi:hypothetical protein